MLPMLKRVFIAITAVCGGDGLRQRDRMLVDHRRARGDAGRHNFQPVWPMAAESHLHDAADPSGVA